MLNSKTSSVVKRINSLISTNEWVLHREYVNCELVEVICLVEQLPQVFEKRHFRKGRKNPLEGLTKLEKIIKRKFLASKLAKEEEEARYRQGLDKEVGQLTPDLRRFRSMESTLKPEKTRRYKALRDEFHELAEEEWNERVPLKKETFCQREADRRLGDILIAKYLSE